MAFIRVVLQDENGSQQGDVIEFPFDVLRQYTGKPLKCLQYVDPYGDTVFNRVQMPDLIDDLRHLKKGSSDENGRILIERIERISLSCEEQPHLYVKFIGD